MSCTLHLDPVDDTADSSQAVDCDCYTQDECENSTEDSTETSANQVSRNYRNDPSYDAVLVIGQQNNWNNVNWRNKRAGIVRPEAPG